MKILLAVSDSAASRAMLDYVIAQPLFGSAHEYTVFHAHPPLSRFASSVAGGTATRAWHREEAQKVIGPALARVREAGLRAQGEWRTGPAGRTIAAYAREGGYDLVAMGTNGWGPLGRLLMGSVSTQVLACCTVPVLLVR